MQLNHIKTISRFIAVIITVRLVADGALNKSPLSNNSTPEACHFRVRVVSGRLWSAFLTFLSFS